MQKISDKIKHIFSITEECVLKLYRPISTLFKAMPVSHEIQTDGHENYQTKSQSFCSTYTAQYNGTTCVQEACCKTPNCMSSCIASGKSFFSSLTNFLCYPFVPCAVVFLPSYCQYAPYTNTEKASSCSCPSNVPCKKSAQDSMTCNYCFRSQQCMLVWASIFLAAVFIILWSLMQDSEMLIKALLYIDNMDTATSILFLTILFTLVSFPMLWGYLPLNLTAGYMYGFLYGLPVVVLAVTIGIAIAHIICKRYLATYVMELLRSRQNFNQLEAILQVIDGSSGLKVIALTRLTPIPFGFQNGLFAVSNVNMKYYLLASSIGLFPTQVLNCYIGSQFRSMEEIMEQNTPGGYIVFIAQIVIGIVLMVFVLRHARKELASALENSANKMASSPSYAEEDKGAADLLEDVKCTQPLSPKIQEQGPFLTI